MIGNHDGLRYANTWLLRSDLLRRSVEHRHFRAQAIGRGWVDILLRAYEADGGDDFPGAASICCIRSRITSTGQRGAQGSASARASDPASLGRHELAVRSALPRGLLRRSRLAWSGSGWV